MTFSYPMIMQTALTISLIPPRLIETGRQEGFQQHNELIILKIFFSYPMIMQTNH